MAARKTAFQKAQASVLKAMRGLEDALSGLVSSEEPMARKKTKKRKTKKARGK